MVSLGALDGLVGFLCFWITIAFALPLMYQTGIYVMNPVLVGFSFNLYQTTFGDDDTEFILISRRMLKAGDIIFPINIRTPYFFEGQKWLEDSSE